MIGYALLIYIGVRIGAAWWYYFLIAMGVTLKTWCAIFGAAKEK